MLAAALVWVVCALLFCFIGFRSGRSETPAGFWANANPPKVRDVRGFNRAVARLWYAFAAMFTLCGVPLLFTEQNGLPVLITLLAAPLSVLILMIAYTRIERSFREK